MTNKDSSGVPAPNAKDLQQSLEQMPEGPNVEFSPWEQEAARGKLPLLGPRADDETNEEEAQSPDSAQQRQPPRA